MIERCADLSLHIARDANRMKFARKLAHGGDWAKDMTASRTTDARHAREKRLFGRGSGRQADGGPRDCGESAKFFAAEERFSAIVRLTKRSGGAASAGGTEGTPGAEVSKQASQILTQARPPGSPELSCFEGAAAQMGIGVPSGRLNAETL